MRLELYEKAVLTCDVPAHRLKSGEIIKVVDHHVAGDGTEGYFIEVFNAVGDTIAVTVVPAAALEPLCELPKCKFVLWRPSDHLLPNWIAVCIKMRHYEGTKEDEK